MQFTKRIKHQTLTWLRRRLLHRGSDCGRRHLRRTVGRRCTRRGGQRVCRLPRPRRRRRSRRCCRCPCPRRIVAVGRRPRRVVAVSCQPSTARAAPWRDVAISRQRRGVHVHRVEEGLKCDIAFRCGIAQRETEHGATNPPRLRGIVVVVVAVRVVVVGFLVVRRLVVGVVWVPLDELGNVVHINVHRRGGATSTAPRHGEGIRSAGDAEGDARRVGAVHGDAVVRMVETKGECIVVDDGKTKGEKKRLTLLLRMRRGAQPHAKNNTLRARWCGRG